MSIREKLEKKSNYQLEEIYRENDRDKWQKEAIEIAGEILKERGEELPEQKPSTKGSKKESPTSTSKALNEEDFTEGSGSFPTLILGGFGVLSVIIGIMLLWNLYSGESTAGWFREISSILLINLGFIGWGFATLISILKKVMNKQNKLLVKLVNKGE
ncbi:hypothetical protein KGY77_08530 [Candidatus Bipolaricaulota bacterium]|nr:hypothetical protein [Candidatus Bipolaricaulota bacterium]